MALKRLAFFVAGAAVGAAGMALAKKDKDESVLQSLVHTGHDLSERVIGTVETIREDVEDYLAEAKYRHDQKMQKAASERAETVSDAAPAQEPAPAAPTPKGAATGVAAKKPAAKKTAAKKSTAKKSTSSAKDSKAAKGAKSAGTKAKGGAAKKAGSA